MAFDRLLKLYFYTCLILVCSSVFIVAQKCGRYKKFENQKWIILTGLYMDILRKMILLNLCKQ